MMEHAHLSSAKSARGAVSNEIPLRPMMKTGSLPHLEMAFAKLKARLRQIAARTLDGLQHATAHALDDFTSLHCRNFLAHANYATD